MLILRAIPKQKENQLLILELNINHLFVPGIEEKRVCFFGDTCPSRITQVDQVEDSGVYSFASGLGVEGP